MWQWCFEYFDYFGLLIGIKSQLEIDSILNWLVIVDNRTDFLFPWRKDAYFCFWIKRFSLVLLRNYILRDCCYYCINSFCLWVGWTLFSIGFVVANRCMEVWCFDYFYLLRNFGYRLAWKKFGFFFVEVVALLSLWLVIRWIGCSRFMLYCIWAAVLVVGGVAAVLAIVVRWIAVVKVGFIECLVLE